MRLGKLGPIRAGASNFEDQAAQLVQAMQLRAATAYNMGAILIDEFDPLIFDDVLRKYPAWSRVEKGLAPGETTGGHDQTGVQTGRAADTRSLGFTATTVSRAARTRRTVKAITSDSVFTLFDRSVYQQQGRRYGDLQAKDVKDLMTACLRQWMTEFYEGDTASDANEFDGLRKIIGSGSTISATASVLNGINQAIVDMMNTSAKDVIPTAVYMNGQVVFYLQQELYKAGNKFGHTTFNVGENVFDLPTLPTPAGMLPIIVDPFNKSVAGTPVTYPTFIVSEDKLKWEYVEPLGNAGPEPKIFEIGMKNNTDVEFKGLMFGALELLGASATDHFQRRNVEARTTVVDPTA